MKAFLKKSSVSESVETSRNDCEAHSSPSQGYFVRASTVTPCPPVTRAPAATVAWLLFVAFTTSTATATPYFPVVGLEIVASTALARFSVRIELMFTAPDARNSAVESTSTLTLLLMTRELTDADAVKKLLLCCPSCEPRLASILRWMLSSQSLPVYCCHVTARVSWKSPRVNSSIVPG